MEISKPTSWPEPLAKLRTSLTKVAVASSLNEER